MSDSKPLKAIILAGGFGTRLRPFTFDVPKPLVDFCNIPIISHQVKALVDVGVKKIVLAVNYRPEAMKDYIARAEKEYGIEIVFSLEDTPMGTAGPLVLPTAKAILGADDAPFFMLNSDVICDFPFKAMKAFHDKHGGEGTILTTKVEDPSKYGVIVSTEAGCIEKFVEKPTVFISDKINAGIYLLSPKILGRIKENTPTSIEREVFPFIAADKALYCFGLQNYWMDIGQPKDFITGTGLHLNYLRHSAPAELASGSFVFKNSNVLVDPSAKVDPTALLGPDVVVGPNAVIGPMARVINSTLMPGVKVEQCALVKNSIVGWGSKVGAYAHVLSSLLSEDVTVAPEVTASELQVLSHAKISDSVQKQILMK